MSMPLLNNHTLEQSSIVANCRMNRERDLIGTNGYDKEIGFHPLEFLREKAITQSNAKWLDLCCGTGKALQQAATIVENEELSIDIVGVDLVGMFAETKTELLRLQLVQASLSDWKPTTQFDLITCVHGLHYIGDKLGLIARVVSWLTENGRFVADIDLNSIKLQNAKSTNRLIVTEVRQQGFEYSSHKKLINCEGHQNVSFSFQYLGADDQAGPNYTGQPAVDSYYERAKK